MYKGGRGLFIRIPPYLHCLASLKTVDHHLKSKAAFSAHHPPICFLEYWMTRLPKETQFLVAESSSPQQVLVNESWPTGGVFLPDDCRSAEVQNCKTLSGRHSPPSCAPNLIVTHSGRCSSSYLSFSSFSNPGSRFSQRAEKGIVTHAPPVLPGNPLEAALYLRLHA